MIPAVQSNNNYYNNNLGNVYDAVIMSCRCWFMVGSMDKWTITEAVAWQLDAFDSWCPWKILLIPYTRHVTNASVTETTGCPPVSSINSASLATWHVQIPGKIITELLVCRPRGRLHSTTWLRGWMPMYSRQTSVSTQLGGRPTIVFCCDVSSTRQHSIRGTPLKKRLILCSV